MARKKNNGLQRTAIGLVGASVVVGAFGGTRVGGDVITPVAQFLPVAGTIAGAGLTLRQLENLKKAGRRRTKNGG